MASVQADLPPQVVIQENFIGLQGCGTAHCGAQLQACGYPEGHQA